MPPPVPLYIQGATNWCWLACAQMLGDAGARGLNLQQCLLAQEFIPGATGCCGAEPVPGSCNQGGDVGMIENLYTKYDVGLDPQATSAPPASEEAFLTLLAQGPVQVHWTSNDQSMAHVALVVGVRPNADGTNFYVINDPWPTSNGQPQIVSYQDIHPLIQSAYGWSWDLAWYSRQAG
jgi:Papain-like cysteine protease AvrRpt2